MFKRTVAKRLGGFDMNCDLQRRVRGKKWNVGISYLSILILNLVKVLLCFKTSFSFVFWWFDKFLVGCKAVPTCWLMMSVCLSVRLSTFWFTSAFKFVLGHVYKYRRDTMQVYRPWSDLFNCNFTFCVSLNLTFSVRGNLISLVNLCVSVCSNSY